ncbi:MAG: RIP metalloprotease RseP [Desulfuromonadaceae bacterium]|nr:RIP metalloprotease RseP [Desulfuromonas sp.]MDY0184704.1 RIP metalloprotease RseP [Desulfuromonadaceae bacterium]
MITLFAGILMLGVLVFVHELGHFAVAKFVGVKVLRFSLGFGPKIIGRTWGETEYQISLIPLGGYVQMLGEGTGEDGESIELDPQDRQRSFAHKSVGRRMAIVAAGPLMNLLLPLVLLPWAYFIGVSIPAYLEESPCVGYVIEGSAASKAGFAVDDCILALNTQRVSSWNDTNKALIPAAGDELVFKTVRGSETLYLRIDAASNNLEGLQSLGILPRQAPIVGTLSPGLPAQAAGLQQGDTIVSIGKEKIRSWYDLHYAIQSLGGAETLFVVDRQGAYLSYSIKPERDQQREVWLVGITPQHRSIQQEYTLLGSIQAGYERTKELVSLTVTFIRKMVAGNVATDNIGGPIMVMQIAGQAAQTDLSTILTVLAFISIQLGILNLLPVPVLDGGHLIFFLFELIFRRPLSLRTREMAQQVGLGLLLLLMLLAFYNDLSRLFLR